MIEKTSYEFNFSNAWSLKSCEIAKKIYSFDDSISKHATYL